MPPTKMELKNIKNNRSNMQNIRQISMFAYSHTNYPALR